MRVRTDDRLYRVDRTWLGPRRFRFPWKATYRDYGLLIALLVVSGGIGWQLGVPITFVSVVTWAVVCILLGKRISTALDHDRPLSALIVRLGQELSAARPHQPPEQRHQLTVSARRWTAGAQPDTRLPIRIAVAVGSVFARLVSAIRRSSEPDTEEPDVTDWTEPENPWVRLASTSETPTVQNEAPEPTWTEVPEPTWTEVPEPTWTGTYGAMAEANGSVAAWLNAAQQPERPDTPDDGSSFVGKQQ